MAAFAGGRALGGLAYGHVRWRASLGTKMLLLGIGMGAVAVAVSQARSLVPFAVGLAILGVFLAPSLVTGYLVGDAIVPERSRTEASTWVNTAVNLGAAMASAVAGVLIDQTTALLPLALVGLLAVLSSTVVPWRRLRHIGG
ncbi:hypothetical protein ACLBWP_13620 [Microbacterium sp. M1A1_1b]|uniref:hypothetical protein n=1 Tax=Curtobacterium sp. VKM Ac-2922 TaxID=2929475 RepID=UPI001FB38FB3|nr:hypothetical protein [Curtobacterium sp. VKM Ac-2922]MCJ1712899.1 hypothetical protein [Curtobacterium sp. VKM Ac-2922]